LKGSLWRPDKGRRLEYSFAAFAAFADLPSHILPTIVPIARKVQCFEDL
jgi:hypothetical protein